MSSTEITSADRPEPIRDALLNVGRGIAAVVALVTAFGSFLGLSAQQVAEVGAYGQQVNDALPIIVSPIVGLVLGGVVLWGHLVAARQATGQSTPSTDPRDFDGTALMRVDGKPLGGVELPAIDATPGASGYPDAPTTGFSSHRV